jgi:hypothetical protein
MLDHDTVLICDRPAENETMAKTPKVSGGGFYQIGEPKEPSAERTAAKAAKAIGKLERAKRKLGKALEPKTRTSILIKRGTKD